MFSSASATTRKYGHMQLVLWTTYGSGSLTIEVDRVWLGEVGLALNPGREDDTVDLRKDISMRYHTS